MKLSQCPGIHLGYGVSCHHTIAKKPIPGAVEGTESLTQRSGIECSILYVLLAYLYSKYFGEEGGGVGIIALRTSCKDAGRHAIVVAYYCSVIASCNVAVPSFRGHMLLYSQ